ncbi:MAG: glycosyltransferase [Balneolales bacterium]|nr:glycosyltransferase [Balneolales bacterium]
MRIIINTSHQRFGGAVQVATSFIHECRAFDEYEFVVWLGSGVGKTVNEAHFPDNFTFRYFDFGVIQLSKIRRMQRELSAAEIKDQPDVIISTSGPTYFKSKAPQIIGFNLPLYIYPESPYVQKLSFKSKLKLTLKKKAHYYFFKRDASAFVVQTNDVNRRVKKALGTDKVYTVSNTYNHHYEHQVASGRVLPERERDEIRLLTLSSYYPHKNLELIPEIAERLVHQGITNVRFILTLKEIDFKKYIKPHEFVKNVGPVAPADCPALYSECDIMFLPTLAECFSASYPEAMKMKKPIITSDLGFAKSICGEAAVYFEPANAISAADKIVQLIRCADLQSRLIKKGIEQLNFFDSAPERAEKYISLCENYKK